jgi:ABC-2 type transport system ATP-binding protein
LAIPLGAVLDLPPMPAVASATHVQRRFGTVLALNDVTFELQRGVTGLLGANGSGKTTLISLLLGVLKPNAGTLEVLGMDPMKAGWRLRQRIGYAPEDERFPPDVKANELVRHFAEMRGIPHRSAVVRASEVLFEVGLGEERFRPIGTMSTGQRQRVKLAQALVHDPELVLLDEPTNGLDQVSDNIVMLEGGKVARSGSVKNLLGGDTPVVVEVVTGARQLADRLTAKGFTAVAKDDLLLTTPSREGVHEAVIATVVELDLEMRRMERGQATLGELFELEEVPAR